MVDIDEMTSDEWISFHRDRVCAFYSKGFEFKPEPECSTCDVHNDYICFEHELEQLKESENA